MSGAATVPLGEVASFVRGITFKPDDVVQLDTPAAVGCMRTKNVQQELDLSDVWGIPARFVRRPEQLLAAGDLLVSSANSWNLVGKACWVPDLPYRATFGGFIAALRADRKQLEPRYLYHWFTSPSIQATVRSFGQKTTNISNLNFDRCLALPIPLPPPDEQRRIAAILDKADELRVKRRAALAKLDTLTQSIFLDMFGDPATNPKGWPTSQLGALSTRITDGTHQPPAWADCGHPFLFVSNVVTGELTFETQKFISDETHNELTRRCPIEVGDVLYSTVGSYGVPAVVRTTRKFAFQRHIAHIKPKRDLLDPEFLRATLASPPLKRQADSAARGVAQKTVNLADIRKFVVFNPPMAVQRQFVEKVDRGRAVKASQVTALSASETLFGSLQRRAFSGEL